MTDKLYDNGGCRLCGAEQFDKNLKFERSVGLLSADQRMRNVGSRVCRSCIMALGLGDDELHVYSDGWSKCDAEITRRLALKSKPERDETKAFRAGDIVTGYRFPASGDTSLHTGRLTGLNHRCDHGIGHEIVDPRGMHYTLVPETVRLIEPAQSPAPSPSVPFTPEVGQMCEGEWEGEARRGKFIEFRDYGGGFGRCAYLSNEDPHGSQGVTIASLRPVANAAPVIRVGDYVRGRKIVDGEPWEGRVESVANECRGQFGPLVHQGSISYTLDPHTVEKLAMAEPATKPVAQKADPYASDMLTQRLPNGKSRFDFEEWKATQSGIASGLSKLDQAKAALSRPIRTGPLRDRDAYGQNVSLLGWNSDDVESV